MTNTNKRYIILFLGVVVFFILFAVVIFLQQSPKQKHSASQDQNVISVHGPDQNGVILPSVTLAPPASTPKAAIQLFYRYYFSSPQNPLANGAYKNNPYLSQNFKDVIGSLYKNGNTPVFCLQNRRAQIIVGKEQSVYYNNGYLEQEVISEAAPGTKDLYIVLLENDGGKWLIFDINCI